MPFVPKVTGQNLALVAVFAGLIVLSTAPPEFTLATGAPITLQTLGVVLAGMVLGAWRGFAAATLYLLVGIANVPVFADGSAGWGVFIGPTGGYLWAFPLAAFAVGWIAERTRANANGVVSLSALMGAGLLSLPIVYAVGVPWLAHFYGVPLLTASEADGPTAIKWGLLPFVVGDVLKVVAAAGIAAAVHRAFPQLLSKSSAQFASKARSDGDAAAADADSATAARP